MSKNNTGDKAVAALAAITYVDIGGKLRMGHRGDATLDSRVPEDVRQAVKRQKEDNNDEE